MVNTEIEEDTGCLLLPLVFCLLPQRTSSTVEQTIKDITFRIEELKWSFLDGL